MSKILDSEGGRIHGKKIRKDQTKYRNGKRIKSARKGLGIKSAEKLAEMLNYSRATVSGWENGAPIANLEALSKLCEILQCDIGYLFGEYETKRIIQAGIGERTGLDEFPVLMIC